MIGFEEWHWPPSQIQSIAITLILSTIILKKNGPCLLFWGFIIVYMAMKHMILGKLTAIR